MSSRHALDDLPLFATDSELGKALMGEKRGCEWSALAPLFEAKGMPKIDPIMGGRFIPAVKRFFEAEYGLATLVPQAPRGVENPEGWKTTARKRRA